MKINHRLLNENCGVYKIINKTNNKIYIGSSKNIYDRLHSHFFELKHNRHHNKHLQYSYNKYGVDSFEHEVIEFCDLEKQFAREQYYITKLKPEYNKVLNVIAVTGYSPTQEVRERISETLKLKYKEGIIDCYRQMHAWKKHFVYDIYNFKLIKGCRNRKECLEFLNMKGFPDTEHGITKNQFIISMTKFKKTFDIRNYIYKNYFKDHKNKYLIVKHNDQIYYFLNRNDLCKFVNIHRSFYYRNIKNKEYYLHEDYEIYYTKNYIKLPFKKEIS